MSDRTCDSSLIMGSGPAPILLAGGGSEPDADFEPKMELVGLLMPGGPAGSFGFASVTAKFTTVFVGWKSPPVPDVVGNRLDAPGFCSKRLPLVGFASFLPSVVVSSFF